MLHRTLFPHIAMFIVLVLGVASTDARAQSAPVLDVDLIDIGDAIDVFVPASGVLVLEVVARGVSSGELPPWVDLVAEPGAQPVAAFQTLSRRLDQMVVWVTGPATYRVLVGRTDPASPRPARWLRLRGQWLPLASGPLHKDGDGDDTGESDNEILPVVVPPTKDGDDTGESDNEILPVVVPPTKDGDGDDTGESDNEILPLTGEPVVGWLGGTHDVALARPSRLALSVMAEGRGRMVVLDEAGRVLASRVVDGVAPRTVRLSVPAGRYRVHMVAIGQGRAGVDAYALSADAEPLAF